MTLEFEAESKAAAERKATQTGMSVNRVEDITDGAVAHAMDPRTTRRRSSGGGRKFFLPLIVVIAAIVIWHFWPQIQRIIHH
jgi:hypothetical protein